MGWRMITMWFANEAYESLNQEIIHLIAPCLPKFILIDFPKIKTLETGV